MNTNKYGQPVYSQNELVDLLMCGINLNTQHPIHTDEDIDLFKIQYLVDALPTLVKSTEEDSINEFDSKCQSRWYMPVEYKELDIAKHCLNLCKTEAELQRVGQELLLYEEKGLMNLLRYLTYLVNIMETNNIIWGIGRGSSVASYVLYLLGIHKIDSMYYDLDPREFLR